MNQQPKVSVGIIFEPTIVFNFPISYTVPTGEEVCGVQKVLYSDGKIEWNGAKYDELLFEPTNIADCSFELYDVTIGINFHWERKENQRFSGALKIIVENEKLTAINIIGIENYLLSVISSEMSAKASKELLKAHAVISRSWLLAQIQKNKDIEASKSEYSACINTEEELIKWYDREDHINFDVCADDHCQRYQGLTRATTQVVKEVIDETWGEVLTYDGKICDARFSKCCGGVFEEFQYCWEDMKYPYLKKTRDSKTITEIPDLTNEDEAAKWIISSPESFCNTIDKNILSQVLNNYDQETVNFYRWKVEYGQKELSELILKRSGIDYGDIIDLIPLERGTSGRLWKLKIVGTKRSKIIGKELEIRRTLSESHLYSSAFIVEKEGEENNIPSKFRLIGAGWGHGVGLCQIGAAVMGEQGYFYDEILLQYYIDAKIEKQY
ncbi:MAG: SpoIID/LytB domain-containing protein [Bacteroidales bacterium]|jgi:SpoIID/LytB domain protein